MVGGGWRSSSAGLGMAKFIFLLSYDVLIPGLGRCPFRGFLKFFLESSSATVGELSVVELTPSSLGWSDSLSASESAYTCGSVIASSSGMSALVASSLTSASVVEVLNSNCCSNESGNFDGYFSCIQQIGGGGLPSAANSPKIDYFPTTGLQHNE